MITLDILRAAGVADSRGVVWLDPLQQAAERFDIDTGVRIIPWLATLVHESAAFTQLEENLNYGAPALLKIWPLTDHRPWGFDLDDVGGYARNPERIANRVYANRMGNGDEGSGEGWTYRGRGPIQLTGRSNYLAATAALDVDLVSNPELLLLPSIGAAAGAWFWHYNHCSALADAGDLDGIRKVVNGGMIGAEAVETIVAQIGAAWTGTLT